MSHRYAWAALALPFLAGPGLAQTVEGPALQPSAVQADVVAAVSARFPAPAAVVLKGLKKSLARNGNGYCGLVAEQAGAAFSPFHVILQKDGKPSVLILADSDKADALLSREAAETLLKNVGCLD